MYIFVFGDVLFLLSLGMIFLIAAVAAPEDEYPFEDTFMWNNTMSGDISAYRLLFVQYICFPGYSLPGRSNI